MPYISSAERIGMEKGMEKGKLEGKLDGKNEIAKKMIDLGIDIEMIINITGLTREEVGKIS